MAVNFSILIRHKPDVSAIIIICKWACGFRFIGQAWIKGYAQPYQKSSVKNEEKY